MAHNFNEYFKYYIELVNESSILDAMHHNREEVVKVYEGLTEEQGNFAYAEDKWTIKDLLAHIIDCERIFNYRALRFARNDKTDLKGFDHDDFVNYTSCHKRTVREILTEFKALRQSTILLFKSFDEEMLARKGTANNMEIDVASLGYMVSGHCKHHLKIIRERYLI